MRARWALARGKLAEDEVLWTVRAARRDGAAQQSVTYVGAMLIEGFSY